MIEHWEGYKIEEFRLPGFSEECKFYKTFFKGDGEWHEVCQVFDCDRHFAVRGGQQHICLMTGIPETIASEYLRQCGKTKMCVHVCPYKKREYQKFMEEHRQYVVAETMRYMEEYLAKEETICGTVL